MKQHTQIYRLKQLRKPVNFKMVLCGQMGAPGRLKPPSEDGDIEFKLHPLAAQQVQASLSTLPWEGNAGEGGGIDSDSDDAEPATDGQEGESEVGRSDGCAAQLKCRWQIEWLLNHGIEGVRIIHNFFQSCHGKGPSDSEGAAVKNHARHQEMRNEKEMNTTEQLVDDCIEHLQIDRLGPVPDFGDDD
jgi:hypothetical protein